MYIDSNIEQIKKILTDAPDKFIKFTLSNPFKKSAEYFKITAEHKIDFYQLTYFYGNKVKHENLTDINEIIEKALQNAEFKQCDIFFTDKNIKIFFNKNGTVKLHEASAVNVKPLGGHNAQKNYTLRENEPIEWLIKLGLMNETGKVYSSMQKKFRQINKFLETSEDILEALPDNAVIIDAGCGKSYLTFALYHMLNVVKGKHAKIIGIDLKVDVLEACSLLARELHFDLMTFHSVPLEEFKPENGKADMVVALHACDTATDYALYNAVKWGCEHIISVPCCQHELYGQIKNAPLSPMLKHGVLKERFAAMLTDTMRAMALEACSYKCQVIEFVDIEHSAKNIMLKCSKVNKSHGYAGDSLRELCESFGVTPKLCVLLGLF